MTSPFPGMDPFLEAQDLWREFHIKFMSWAQDALAERVPDQYEVRIEERLSLIYQPGGDLKRHVWPDLMVTHDEEKGRQRSGAAAAVATVPARTALAPGAVSVALPRLEFEEISEQRLAIRRLPTHEVVTVLELLSPSNKEAPGEALYSRKRLELIDQPVHLVELDLLLGGQRLMMAGPLPPGDYFALASRAESRPLSEVYSWSVRDPLPTVPIPLLAPDPDVPLDLAAIFQTVYRRGRYERSIDYAAPLELPLSADDRAWAEAKAREFAPRARPGR